MDLLETRNHARRHPWELSRAHAIEKVARRHSPFAVRSVLDWGCGDAFTGRFLLDALGASELVGVDPHLSEEQRTHFAQGDARVALYSDERELRGRRFDVVLCLDVVEHVPDDAALLELIKRSFLADGGRLIVTVPAFQALFSTHDVALKHFRRYSLRQLENVLRRVDLEILGSGYLFSSLLPARVLGKLLERGAPTESSAASVGIGSWNGGPLTSRVVETVLSADNALLLSLSTLGVKVPGLSVWAACSSKSG